MGKLKLMTIIGTRPEIIRLSATIKCCDRYFEQILVHTGQNYDYTLNQVFFDDLGLRAPDYYLDAVGDDLGATIGNIIEKSYKLMMQVMAKTVGKSLANKQDRTAEEEQMLHLLTQGGSCVSEENLRPVLDWFIDR